MNLVLIGYRGTGKTEISRSLSKSLGYDRIGMDETLVHRFGTTIPEFVKTHGWDAFRDAESTLASELGQKDHLVIDCGGGVIVRDGNITSLRGNGKVVWLTASVQTIVERIGGDNQRPSLTGTKSFTEEVEEVLSQRLPLYRKACDIEVTTDNRPIEEIVSEILSWWKTSAG